LDGENSGAFSIQQQRSQVRRVDKI